jgi:hypothetical protein
MTTDELNALEPGTLLYVPAADDVLTWEFAGPVNNRSWYTLVYPPDQDGTIGNRRPVYVAPIELLHATLDEQSAWHFVAREMGARKDWIHKRKLATG